MSKLFFHPHGLTNSNALIGCGRRPLFEKGEMPRPATKKELEIFTAPTLVIAAAECISGSHFPSKEKVVFINQRIQKFLGKM